MPSRTYKSLLSHPDLKVTRRQALVRPRESVHLCGVSPPRSLGTFGGDVDSMEAALLERMYFCRVDGEIVAPLSIGVDRVDVKLGGFADAVLREIPTFTPVSLSDFVEMYKGPKKEVYRKAVDSLLSRPVRRRDAESNSFVKREKAKFKKAPRCIQPRDPRYNAAVGRFLKPLEHHLYRAVDRVYGDRHVITKGLNLVGTASSICSKWNSFSSPVAVGLDASSFDAHVSAGMLKWEHSIYNRIFKDPKLAGLLKWQVANRGKAFCPDGKIKYSVEGRRFSGDMNTAMGNCLIMTAMVWAYAQDRGVGIKLVNNGDDCVVFMEASDLHLFSRGLPEWFLELGFRLTIESPVYVLEQVEFCQMHPVFNGEEYVMVRSPKTAFEKDTMCTLSVTDAGYKEWLRGVSDCGLACTSGVPVLQSFYQCLGTFSSDITEDRLLENTGMRHMSKGMVKGWRAVGEDARFSFWLAFGISPQTQLDIEESLPRDFDLQRIEGFIPTYWPFDTTLPRLPENANKENTSPAQKAGP